ncbi:MAG TPA: hypothetical protein DCY93_03095 [Firmicutes bacterium]|nr:hypothetical protein [Bacillota bacterium]
MCFISSYKLASFSDGKREKKKAIIYALIAFIIIVLYFGGCQLIVFLFVLKSYTLSFAKQVFLVTLFASPSIIIVLPLIALILSGC